MQSDSGRTTSLWMETATVPDYPPLAASTSADVCVVGAGIAGLTTAYLIAREGPGVVLLDDGPVGGGETGRTTAHLTCALDDRYFNLERAFGIDGARIAAESHSAAVDQLEAIVRSESIDCDFLRLDGFLFLAAGDEADTLRRELEACHRAGLGAVRYEERLVLPGGDHGPALRFPAQAQFHPLRYLAGLARAAVRAGVRIHCGSHVSDLKGAAPGGSGAGTVTTSDGHEVTARDIVVCTNSPINDRVVMHTKQAPYRTFVVAMHVPRGATTPALLWDTGDPYHYVRLQPGRGTAASDWLIVGGEDHKTGQRDDAEARFVALERWARERFPAAEATGLRWSGQVMEPVDHLAYIGRNPGEEHVFIATGDSGNGMTHGTIAGMLITDLVLGRENPWSSLYDPSRVTLDRSTAKQFLKENLNVAVQYADLALPGDVRSVDAIRAGEGAVVRRGTRKIAAYRDEQGQLHERSALCTHLYCVVDWNHTEKTWDCPCHGSRFTALGKVVNGPAISDLLPAESEE